MTAPVLLGPDGAPLPPAEKSAVTFGPSESIGKGDGWLMRAIGGGKTNVGVAVSEYNALTFPAVYAAVRIIAGVMGQLPIGIFRRTEDGFNPVTDHPLSWKLGLRPNPLMSSFTLRSTRQTHALLWGNGYCEIERNGRGQAVGLWPRTADRTWPVVTDGELRIRTNVNGVSITLDPEDVWQLKALGTDG